WCVVFRASLVRRRRAGLQNQRDRTVRNRRQRRPKRQWRHFAAAHSKKDISLETHHSDRIGPLLCARRLQCICRGQDGARRHGQARNSRQDGQGRQEGQERQDGQDGQDGEAERDAIASPATASPVGNPMIEILFAFAAGVLTIASPCVLPMAPLVLSASIAKTGRARPLFIAFAFAAFGALMLWRRPMQALAERLGGVTTRVDELSRRAGAGNAGGFVLGLTLGVLWTPCAGPVLGSILTLIATATDLTWAAVLLVCYALGAGIPMLAIGYGGRYAATRIRRIAPYVAGMQRAFGVLVIAIAVATAFQLDTPFVAWLSNFLPEGALPL